MSYQSLPLENLEKVAKERLDQYWERAKDIFVRYGDMLSVHTASAFLYALEQKNVEGVLEKLETHWEKHLKYRHPTVRGGEHDPETEIFFEKLMQGMGIKPAEV